MADWQYIYTQLYPLMTIAVISFIDFNYNNIV